MIKPPTIHGYNKEYTHDCERVLVTLLRGLGPWKDSIFLVGGLAPRYIVQSRPPDVPPHAGTSDVDIVIDLQILADTEAYSTLEENIRRMGFERSENSKGQKVSWRWQTRSDSGALMMLEFLADDPDLRAGRPQELPTKGNLSAMNIPRASIVFELHDVTRISAELLGGGGIATESIRHANLVSFTCLKAFAYEDRRERKDAHDLLYCLEHADDDFEAVVQKFRDARKGQSGSAIEDALNILRERFCKTDGVDGYLKDGPVSVARFEHGDEELPSPRELRALRQRQVNLLIEMLVDGVYQIANPDNVGV